jgi:hypothetical protein
MHYQRVLLAAVINEYVGKRNYHLLDAATN